MVQTVPLRVNEAGEGSAPAWLPTNAAVGLAGGNLAQQAGGQELLAGPGLGAGPLRRPIAAGLRCHRITRVE